MLAACGGLWPADPASVAQRSPLPLCGVEEIVDGAGWNVEAQRCLLSASETGEGAELITHHRDVPQTTQYTRVHSDGTIEMFLDLQPDTAGEDGWTRLRCAALERNTDLSTADERLFFVVDCVELGLEGEPMASPSAWEPEGR